MTHKSILKPIFAMITLVIVVLIIVFGVIFFTPVETMVAGDDTGVTPTSISEPVRQIELDQAAPPRLNQ